jgi:hypothetical protein
MKFVFDKKRSGYWVTLDGHQFFGHLTGDEEGRTFIEFQDLPMFGKGMKDWVCIEMPKTIKSNDILETLFEQELARIFP